MAAEIAVRLCVLTAIRVSSLIGRHRRTDQLKPSILIVNGPGLGDLSVDGAKSDRGLGLTMIRDASRALCEQFGIQLDFRHTEDLDKVSQWLARESQEFDGVIVNPVGYSRATTVPIENYRAAIQTIAHLNKPVIEVHINNIFHHGAESTQPLREDGGDMGFICGFGLNSYLAAIRAIGLRLQVHHRDHNRRINKVDKVFILNGPNLNLLGRREPEIYGRLTLEDLARRCAEVGVQRGLDVEFRQTNHEGELVDWIQEAIDVAKGIIVNAAAYTHTSVAIHDALRANPRPKIELHISNPHLREAFRQFSYVSPVVDGIVAGLGTSGYALSLQLMADLIDS
ncbi:MAG: type II 3-dehydroquinate dehydratase [Woeseiaceae bacterium]|nr:type II 3-dehydroquinate dehydratase [Woeseiaceae bacterium]